MTERITKLGFKFVGIASRKQYNLSKMRVGFYLKRVFIMIHMKRNSSVSD